MRIVFVDDDLQFLERAGKAVCNFFAGLDLGEQKKTDIKSYQEGYTLLNDLACGKNYDIYFLDVEMPGLGGIELAQRIKDVEDDAIIVFLSAYEQYALPSYKVRAYYYILKREYHKEIPVILERIICERYRKENDQEDYYVIQNQVRWDQIRLNDILYLIKEKKYVVFHCIREREYKERGTMAEAYCKLPQNRFFYVDKACIVNLKYVIGMGDDIIKLGIGEESVELPVSRRRGKSVREGLARYWGMI